MPRNPSNSDVFNAVAEVRRRRILECLAEGERSVSQLVDAFDLDQPSISKHLRVLKDVGLVDVRREGRRRLYSLRPEQLKTVRDWANTFERFWDQHLDTVKHRAESTARSARPVSPKGTVT